MTGDILCASLDIINDNVVENNEELLTVTLSADDPPVTTLTATSATIDIRENDNDGNLKHIIYMTLYISKINIKGVVVQKYNTNSCFTMHQFESHQTYFCA